MRKLLTVVILTTIGVFFTTLAWAWFTPRPTTQFTASMDVQAPSTDTHAVGTETVYWRNGYFRHQNLRYRTGAPTQISSYGILWASNDNTLWFTDAAGTSTQVV